MTTSHQPISFAKNMDSSNTKRLIRRKREDAFSSCRKKARLVVSSTSSLKLLQPTCELDEVIANYEIISTPNSNRLFGGIMSKSCGDDDTKVNNRKRWRSPIGTIADHRMTNNNRIRKRWDIFAVILLSVILCIVQVTVVSGHPDPEPIHVSHSYTKTVSNTIPTSTTSRSTTLLSSFLPSDAIPSSVINYKNFNTFAGNRSSSGNNGFLSSFVSKHIGATGSNDNANSKSNQSSSRRTTTANNASRKVFSSSSSSSPVTSIDRPFYTKITSNDAIATPSHYKRTKSGSSKKTKKNKKSSRPSSSSFGKYTKTKGSKEQDASGSMSIEDIDNDDEYAFMPQTTEKSYHPPKLSLEPFFNFLTSLATASREVIMSKEQHHSHQHQTEQSIGGTGGLGTTGSGSKYSPSYDTINQSMREGAKKSKKSKKGKGSKGSKKKKGHVSKGSKKGSKGGGKRQRFKSIEISTEEEDEEIELDPVSEEAFAPISLPNPIIDSPEADEAENDNPLDDDTKATGGLHILDVLRTPMVPDYDSQPPPPPAAKAEPLVGLDYQHETESSPDNSNNGIPKSDSGNVSSSSLLTPSSAYATNPPSGRANLNKGQGYIAFDNYEGSGNKNMSGGSSNMIQKQRSERDPMDSYHDQHGSTSGGVDLQAQESISHAQIVPSPFGMKNNAGGGLGPYQYQQQQQLTKSNSDLSLSASGSQQVSITQTNSAPSFSQSKNSAEQYDDEFDKARPKGKNDFVSKYPTTFVYQSSSSSDSGPPAPGSQPPSPPVSYMSATQSHAHHSQPVMSTYMNPSPPGSLSHMNPSQPAFPQNNLYGSVPPSNGHPSRMNKLRPNLHSYYDSSYHNYAGVGENQVASDMIGIRQPYGPPHFKPPPPHAHGIRNPYALPPPPRFVNGYGNRPGFMMPHRGSHYVGHTFNVGPLPSKAPPTQSYNDPNSDYQQDVTGNGNNNDDASVGNQETGGADAAGSATDNLDQYTLSELEENSAAENSENKKVGIMDSFDLFYKEYKILTWVAVFFVTSMALLTLLVYLYVNNPPTEVVQARQLFPWNELLQNQQIKKFLSSLTEPSSSKRKRKKDDPVDDDDDGYIKPYGYGFGGKSGKQRRKQTRNQQDKNKLVSRTNKIKRINESGGNSTVVAN